MVDECTVKRMMIKLRRKLAEFDVLKMVLVLWLVAAMPLMPGGELIPGHDDDGCEDTCDESCQDCGICVGCARTVHMIPTASFELNSHLRASIGTISTLSFEHESMLGEGIDHPPQN